MFADIKVKVHTSIPGSKYNSVSINTINGPLKIQVEKLIIFKNDRTIQGQVLSYGENHAILNIEAKQGKLTVCCPTSEIHKMNVVKK